MKINIRNPRLLLIIAVMIGLIGLIAWPREKVLKGKTESQWIQSIKYLGDENQLKRWRALGPEGLNLLARRLDRGSYYYKFYHKWLWKIPPKLRGTFLRIMPDPYATYQIREKVICLLSQLGKEAKPVEPAIARALNYDLGANNSKIRLAALVCYEGLLTVMSEEEKSARLPLILKALRDSDSDVRTYAASDLWFFTNHPQMVVPALAKTMKEGGVLFRLESAKSLAHIDPKAAIQAGVVPVAINILNDNYAPNVCQAAQLLDELGAEPVLAVPALVKSLQETNQLVVCAAARALGRFRDQSKESVPALRKVLENDNPNVRAEAMNALQQIDPLAASSIEPQ